MLPELNIAQPILTPWCDELVVWRDQHLGQKEPCFSAQLTKLRSNYTELQLIHHIQPHIHHMYILLSMINYGLVECPLWFFTSGCTFHSLCLPKPGAIVSNLLHLFTASYSSLAVPCSRWAHDIVHFLWMRNDLSTKQPNQPALMRVVPGCAPVKAVTLGPRICTLLSCRQSLWTSLRSNQDPEPDRETWTAWLFGYVEPPRSLPNHRAPSFYLQEVLGMGYTGYIRVHCDMMEGKSKGKPWHVFSDFVFQDRYFANAFVLCPSALSLTILYCSMFWCNTFGYFATLDIKVKILQEQKYVKPNVEGLETWSPSQSSQSTLYISKIL